LKALLISRGVPFPRSHDLNALYKLVTERCHFEGLSLDHAELAKFAGWAGEAGHPGDWPAITDLEARKDVMSAKGIVEAVSKVFV